VRGLQGIHDKHAADRQKSQVDRVDGPQKPHAGENTGVSGMVNGFPILQNDDVPDGVPGRAGVVGLGHGHLNPGDRHLAADVHARAEEDVFGAHPGIPDDGRQLRLGDDRGAGCLDQVWNVRAQVVEVVVRDQNDVGAGDVILLDGAGRVSRYPGVDQDDFSLRGGNLTGGVSQPFYCVGHLLLLLQFLLIFSARNRELLPYFYRFMANNSPGL